MSVIDASLTKMVPGHHILLHGILMYIYNSRSSHRYLTNTKKKKPSIEFNPNHTSKNNGSIRGSNTGPLADKLSTQGVTLSENHTTRPTELLISVCLIKLFSSLRPLQNMS